MQLRYQDGYRVYSDRGTLRGYLAVGSHEPITLTLPIGGYHGVGQVER